MCKNEQKPQLEPY